MVLPQAQPAETLQIETPEAYLPLLEPARYKGAAGGRGSGKSWFFAELLIERCLMDRSTRAVCVREVQRSLKDSVKRLLEVTISRLGVGPAFRVKEAQIEVVGGPGRIIFQGMQNHTAESIKSLEGYDVAWVEEAQALSQRSLDLLRPTIRRESSELWFSWNPRNASDPVEALFNSEPPLPNCRRVEVTHADNPWFPAVLRDEMEWDRGHDPQKFSHVWGGGYLLRSDATVFQNWRVADFKTPVGAKFLFGGDWGFSVDPAVLVRAWIAGRTLHIDREVYLVGCEIDFLPFLFGGGSDRELQAKNATAWADLPPASRGWPGIPGAREWPIIADSARPETISYLRRHGFPKIVPARKGAGSIEEGIEFLRSFDVVVHERCPHAQAELATYSYRVDRMTDQVLPVLEDKRNHVIDALRYAVERVRRPMAKTRSIRFS